MFEAKLKSRSQPKLGALAVTFPIPEERYETMILALQNLQIGDVRKQDCCIESIRAPDCPALVRMTGAKCALIRFFSVASNMLITSILNFLHIRKRTLAIAAPANQSQAHIRTLTLVRIPAALYRWRRGGVRPQRRRVETRPAIFFLTVFHKVPP